MEKGEICFNELYLSRFKSYVYHEIANNQISINDFPIVRHAKKTENHTVEIREIL